MGLLARELGWLEQVDFSTGLTLDAEAFEHSVAGPCLRMLASVPGATLLSRFHAWGWEPGDGASVKKERPKLPPAARAKLAAVLGGLPEEFDGDARAAWEESIVLSLARPEAASAGLEVLDAPARLGRTLKFMGLRSFEKVDVPTVALRSEPLAWEGPQIAPGSCGVVVPLDELEVWVDGLARWLDALDDAGRPVRVAASLHGARLARWTDLGAAGSHGLFKELGCLDLPEGSACWAADPLGRATEGTGGGAKLDLAPGRYRVFVSRVSGVNSQICALREGLSPELAQSSAGWRELPQIVETGAGIAGFMVGQETPVRGARDEQVMQGVGSHFEAGAWGWGAASAFGYGESDPAAIQVLAGADGRGVGARLVFMELAPEQSLCLRTQAAAMAAAELRAELGRAAASAGARAKPSRV